MFLELYCKGGMKMDCEKLIATLHEYYYFTHVLISLPFTFLHKPAPLLLSENFYHTFTMKALRINGKYFS